MNSVPKQIGRYTVERLLGRGAMGNVYLGRDPELDRAVAIKTLRDLGLGPDAMQTFLERFRNEARAAARLHHPSIVQVYDVGEDEGTGPFLVFEYVPGATLKHFLRSRGPLPPKDVVRTAQDVAEALDLAHAEEIIHRDIKPDNLLVTEDGGTKLADFGIARVPNATLTKEGQFLGTPCYAAPETLIGAKYSPKSDLFSMAAVLYEAVAGVRAFPGDEAVAVAHQVVHDDPPLPSAANRGVRVPPAVDAVIMRGLSKDPEARFDSARTMADALASAYDKAGALDVPQVPLGRRSGTSAEPSGNFAFGAILVGAVAVGVAVVFAFSGGPSAEDGRNSRSRPAAGGRDTTSADASGPLVEILEVDSSTADEPPPPEPTHMNRHQREEAAKDAMDAARRAIASQNWDRARQALDQARTLDPSNPDITTLARQLP